MYICDYVMTGRTKAFTGNTMFEIHEKFLNEYKEAEKEVRKVEIFKFNKDSRDFSLVISYQLFKVMLDNPQIKPEEMKEMVDKRKRIH